MIWIDQCDRYLSMEKNGNNMDSGKKTWKKILNQHWTVIPRIVSIITITTTTAVAAAKRFDKANENFFLFCGKNAKVWNRKIFFFIRSSNGNDHIFGHFRIEKKNKNEILFVYVCVCCCCWEICFIEFCSLKKSSIFKFIYMLFLPILLLLFFSISIYKILVLFAVYIPENHDCYSIVYWNELIHVQSLFIIKVWSIIFIDSFGIT